MYYCTSQKLLTTLASQFNIKQKEIYLKKKKVESRGMGLSNSQMCQRATYFSYFALYFMGVGMPIFFLFARPGGTAWDPRCLSLGKISVGIAVEH